MHYLAQLPGENQIFVPRHARGFYKQDLAAGRRRRQPRHHAHRRLPPRYFVKERRSSQQRADFFGADFNAAFAPLDKFARHFAAQPAQRALQIAQARFARVVGDQMFERCVRKLELLFANAVLVELTRQQMPTRYLHLLVGRIAGDGYLLHAVAQRPRHRREQIRRRDKHDLRQVEIDV